MDYQTSSRFKTSSGKTFKMKTKATDQRQIFLSDTSDKVLLSRRYKEFSKFNKKRKKKEKTHEKF